MTYYTITTYTRDGETMEDYTYSLAQALMLEAEIKADNPACVVVISEC